MEFINNSYSLYFDKCTLAYSLSNFLHLVIAHKNLECKGIRKIRNIIKKNCFFIFDFPFILMDNLAPDNHLFVEEGKGGKKGCRGS